MKGDDVLILRWDVDDDDDDSDGVFGPGIIEAYGLIELGRRPFHQYGVRDLETNNILFLTQGHFVEGELRNG